ncbi:IS4 family transposase, partial [Rhodococcus erythropolis]|nr:IS4 family transposase [Rhodococcus erythropolis]
YRNLPTAPANDDCLGWPASSRGEQSPFPQARLAAVAERGTHAAFDAAIGPCRTSERELGHNLIDQHAPRT